MPMAPVSPAGVFGPDMWTKIVNDPDTASVMTNPAVLDRLRSLEKDPSTATRETLSGPDMAKVLKVLGTSPDELLATSASDVESAEPPEHLSDAEKAKWRAEREKALGNAAYKSRNLEVALEHYTRAFDLDPDNVMYLTNRAAAKYELDDLDGAIEDCKESIRLNAEKSLHTDYKIVARAYARIGNCFVKKQDYTKAIENFEKSLLESHDDKVHLRLNEVKRAKAKADEVAYRDPEKSRTAREEGNTNFREGDFPAAIRCYTEAIKRNPDDPAPYSNRAAAYTKLGEFPLGLKDCEKCLELDDKYLKAYSRKGAIHFFMKEYHKCLDVYERGLSIDPNNADMKEGLQRTRMAIQQQQSSSEVDEKQVQHNMSDPEIQAIMADPTIMQVLKEMQENPEAGMKALRNPAIAGKVQKLIAAGVLRTG